ncbi:hypothetical protein EIP86_008831 [Pleurotus ostreatoroseus]|nr:hypothetical protein EIP86_008831 [Pleurotus ostreatoroseus]
MEATGNAFGLPLETIDEIVSYLQDDNDALQVCTLLGGNWTDSARRCIFKSTTLRVDDPDNPNDLVSDSATRRLSAFAAFLGRTPHVRRSMQELHLVSEHAYSWLLSDHWNTDDFNIENLIEAENNALNANDDEHDLGEAIGFQIHLRDLFRVLQRLPALRKLSLEDILWFPLAADGEPNLVIGPQLDMTLDPCPWVESFCFNHLPSITHPEDLRRLAIIFHLLPGIFELRICSSVRYPAEDGNGPLEARETIPFPQGMSLRSLIVKNMLTPCILSSLIHTNTVDSLVSLEISAKYLLRHEIGRMGAFFEAVGSQLKQLRLSLSCYPRLQEMHDEAFVRNVWRDLRLSKCVALRTLTLETDFRPARIRPWVTTEGIIDSLSIDPSSLQHLVLTLPKEGYPSLRTFNSHRNEPRWNALQTCLLAFPALEGLRFVMVPGFVGLDEITKRRVKKMLPDLEAKGLLQLD